MYPSDLPKVVGFRQHTNSHIPTRFITVPSLGAQSYDEHVSFCLFECVCCVCLSESIFAELHVQSFTKLFVCACYLWPRLGSSIAALPYVVYFLFMDDVMFAHNGLDVKKDCITESDSALNSRQYAFDTVTGCGICEFLIFIGTCCISLSRGTYADMSSVSVDN